MLSSNSQNSLKSNIAGSVAWVYVLLVISGLSCIQYLWPLLCDDLNYGTPYLDYLQNNANFPGWQPWFDTVRFHFMEMNGRLADKFIIPFLLLPKWAFAGLFGLSLWLIIRSVGRLVWGRLEDNPFGYILIAAAVLLCSPWRVSVFICSMAINYVFVLALLLWLFTLFFHPDRYAKKGKGYFLLVAAVSAITTSSHEGVALSAAVGMLIYFGINFKRRSPIQLYILIGGILGIVFILCNPGFYFRISDTPPFANFDISTFIKIAKVSILYMGMYVVWIVCKIRTIDFKSPVLGILTTVFIFQLITFVFNLYTDAANRLWFCATILAYIGIFLIARPLLARIGKVWQLIITCLIYIISAVVLFSAVCWQIKLRNDMPIVVDKFVKSTDGVVYHDWKAKGPLVPLSMELPSFWQYTDDTMYKYRADGREFELLPEDLEEFDAEQVVPFNEELNLYKFHNIIVRPETPDFKDWYLVISYRNSAGRMNKSPAHYHRIPSVHGDKWLYLEPYFRSWDFNREIVGITAIN